MAWRPSQYLLKGELDNTKRGKVTGWMQFAGLRERVTFDLKGDFHRDIRGTRIRLTGEGEPDDPAADGYMEGFAQEQRGNVGDITAGMPPRDYVGYPYVEWFSTANGRVVLELEPSQVKVIGQLTPWRQWEPVSREAQSHNMASFLAEIAQASGIPGDQAVCITPSTRNDRNQPPHSTRRSR